MTKHAKTGTRAYQCWRRMIQNCEDEKYPAYKNYGARGIKVCPKWKIFSAFLSDMGDIPPDCNSLVLINRNQDYSKENCQWGRYTLKGRQRKHNSKNQMMPICLMIDRNHYDYISKQALQASLEKGSYVEPNEMIREALYKAFPIPTQVDMFGQRK